MGAVDPVRDREVIEFELALADLSVVEKRLDKTQRAARTGDKEAKAELPVLEKANGFLKDGRGLWEAKLSADELAMLKPLQLLTVKPILYAANVTDAELSGHEGPHLAKLRAAIAASGEQAEVVPFSAKIEAELAELSPEDRAAFLESLGLESAGLDRLIRAGYHLLGLQTYFTAGEQEVRAWTIHRGDTAPKAAAVIPHRLRARVHPRRDRRLRRLRRERRLEGRAREGRRAVRRQGVRRPGRRRTPLPVQRLPRKVADVSPASPTDLAVSCRRSADSVTGRRQKPARGRCEFVADCRNRAEPVPAGIDAHKSKPDGTVYPCSQALRPAQTTAHRNGRTRWKANGDPNRARSGASR